MLFLNLVKQFSVEQFSVGQTVSQSPVSSPSLITGGSPPRSFAVRPATSEKLSSLEQFGWLGSQPPDSPPLVHHRPPKPTPSYVHVSCDYSVCVCMHIYIYIYTYMYTYVYIYIYNDMFPTPADTPAPISTRTPTPTPTPIPTQCVTQ